MATTSPLPPPPRLVDYALAYARRGIPVFPCKARDKKPLTDHGLKDATLDADQIQRWWKTWRSANIGIPTGPRSGWLVVDIDTKAGATYDTLAALGKLPATLTAQTGSGGLHLVFRYPKSTEVRNSAGKVAQGIDVRGDGGYIVVAPSIHPSGGVYEWVKEIELAPCPTWLLGLMTERPMPRLVESSATRNISSDDRDAYWLDWAMAKSFQGTSDDMGFQLAQQLLLDPNVRDIDGTLAAYARLATFDGNNPFTEKDIDRWLKSAQASDIVRSGEKAKKPRAQTARPLRIQEERPKLHAVPAAKPVHNMNEELQEQPAERRIFHRTELGNAERLLAAYGDRLRYTKAAGYIAWDGKRWRTGAELDVEHWCKAVIRDMYREAADLAGEAAQCTNEGEREQIAGEAQELMKWAMGSERAKMVSAMLMLARSACAVDINQFDREPWLLNCQNGTVDLRLDQSPDGMTARLRGHRQADNLRQICPHDYTPEAQCPQFLRFLSDIMLGDQEMIDYLQRVLGYCLTGHVREQNWWLLLGDGENGKGTLMETFARALGSDYCAMLEPESITISGQARKGSEASPDMADLHGKRFVRITETAEGARIDAARIKKLSGGDTIKARYLNKDFFEFLPTFKIFIYTNHKPESRETTHAFWRRVRYLPFDFKPTKKDETLLDKLAEELPGILAWAVRGCLAWQREGLNPPQRVLEATEAYRAESDILGDFLSTYCVMGSSYEVRASVLYDKYVKWCNETGEHQQNMRRFGKAITERGVQRRTNNGIIYVGIGVRHDDSMFD